MEMLSPFIIPLSAFVAMLVLIPLASKFAHAVDLVDRPGGRKKHEGDIPLIGGLVIFCVFMIASGIGSFSLEQNWPLLSGLVVLLIAGGLDDMQEINPWVKFAAQILAAFLVVLPGHATIYQLGDLFGLGRMGLDFMAIPFSLAAVTLLINAMNLMDGLDGLTSGKSVVIIGWLSVAAYVAGYDQMLAEMQILLACLLGFLVFNMRYPGRKKASVFLGDAGSMCLGLTIAWYAIGLAKDDVAPALEPISVAWVLALPIMDTCAQFFRRMRAGKHPFSPDRGHFHHHFVDAGHPIEHATPMILLLGGALGAVGYGGAMVGVPLVILTVGWIAMLLAHMLVTCKPQIYITLLAMLRVDKAADKYSNR